jgi:multimeric flavodoxin WrbA
MSNIKIAGMVGSPRMGMNTDVLVGEILRGAHRSGAAISKIYLHDLSIGPCRACKVQDGLGCVIHDGMDAIYQLLENVDGLVLGTPVYYNTVSSQMKLMLDRCYCLAKPVALPSGKTTYQTAVQKRKQGVVVSVGGSGENPGCVMPVFDLWSPEVNLALVDAILVTQAQLGLPPKDSPQLLQQAFDMGERLVRLIKGET